MDCFSLITVNSENCLKVSEMSRKGQGIFNFLMSGNPEPWRGCLEDE